jgi:hypothetical protein
VESFSRSDCAVIFPAIPLAWLGSKQKPVDPAKAEGLVANVQLRQASQRRADHDVALGDRLRSPLAALGKNCFQGGPELETLSVERVVRARDVLLLRADLAVEPIFELALYGHWPPSVLPPNAARGLLFVALQESYQY